MTLLSSSVSSPDTSKWSFLWFFVAKSRTKRGNRLKTDPIGSMRIPMTRSWISRMLRSNSPTRSCRIGSREIWKLALRSLSMDCVITSSPTRLIILSILVMSTRIDPVSAFRTWAAASCCCCFDNAWTTWPGVAAFFSTRISPTRLCSDNASSSVSLVTTPSSTKISPSRCGASLVGSTARGAPGVLSVIVNWLSSPTNSKTASISDRGRSLDSMNVQDR